MRGSACLGTRGANSCVEALSIKFIYRQNGVYLRVVHTFSSTAQVTPQLDSDHSYRYNSERMHAPSSHRRLIMSNRISKLLGLTIVLLTFVKLVCATAAVERPNILFIYTDDQSYRSVSCYEGSYHWVHTPNIDTLAQQGVRFKYAYIGTWCMPSRATMLTGHLQHGVESMRLLDEYPASTYDPQQCPFWPAVFRTAGYFTAQIGKWHTGTATSFGRDWDYQMVWNRPRVIENASNYYYDQLLEVNGAPAKLYKGYSTDNYTDWAVDFIRGKGCPQDKPWYLWLCYGAVHGPRTPADRHRQDYKGAIVPMPTDMIPPRAGKPRHMRDWDQWNSTDKSREQLQEELDHMVIKDSRCARAIDEGVGKILNALADSGQVENTLVVFTSDQGFAFGQHGLQMKVAPYDAALRAPLIFSMPGTIGEGKMCSTAVGGQDLVPTFFSFAGLDLPWEMHGSDLTPLLQNPESSSDHAVLITYTGWEYGTNTIDIPLQSKHGSKYPWWVSYRQGDFKYIRHLIADEIEELYRLDTDPEELTNLALDADYAEQLAKYRQAAIEELRRTHAPFVDRMPEVRIDTR